MTLRSTLRALGALAALAGCTHRAPPPALPLPSPQATPHLVPTVPDKVPLHVDSLDISRLSLAVFGDSTPDAASVDDGDGPTFDIDVRSFETHERVEYYVALFTGEGHDRIAERLDLGTRYEPLMRTKLRDAGLPEDLVYLAMVESGFSPDAYSRAAAVGLWQFMASTARSVGLRVDWWVDERRDPARSTDAAIRHLKALRREFDGSLFLAAAAYNGGSSRVSKGLTRYASTLEGSTGDEMYFALSDQKYLREETRNYVPQIIATALVAKNAAKYGMTVHTLAPYAYDSVRVGPSTPLAMVARASGSTTAEIVGLNPHILRGVTPPKDTYFVHVPVGRADATAAALAAGVPADHAPFQRVPSKTGETFAAVAKRVGLSSRQLAWYNPADGVRKGKLSAGTTILVPSAEVVSAARDVPNPAIETYRAAPTVRRVPAAASRTATTNTSGTATTHRVQRGETLGGIARAFGVTVAAIKSANGLSSDAIREGQVLIIR